ncbi:uncharacterized protein LOC109604022 [Aethina tumida]|uniref:uncharacterized protein LOC109604022 n=1 Tax=Aethina tumida TaxID=116153 RepID=UPI002147DC6F|nr:uncharacterized protein LOC109604022 [Aethina tumida]
MWRILFFVACVCLFWTLSSTKAEKQHLQNIIKECQSDPKMRVSKTVIRKIKMGEWTEEDNLKRALFCIAKKTGIQNEDGTLNPTKIQSKWATHYDSDDLNRLMGCVKEYDTPEKTAYELFKCRQSVLGIDKNFVR